MGRTASAAEQHDAAGSHGSIAMPTEATALLVVPVLLPAQEGRDADEGEQRRTAPGSAIAVTMTASITGQHDATQRTPCRAP